MDFAELRTHPATQDWIEQFSPADRSTASFLLESLIFVSHADFISGLAKAIQAAHKTADRPAALFAVREIAERSKRKRRRMSTGGFLAWALEHDPTLLAKQGPHPPESNDLVIQDSYFDLNDRNARPHAVRPGGNVGSEGLVSHLLRDLCQPTGANSFSDHPSISSMKARKTRDIFFVDDFIGSGARVRAFADGFYAHPTIKSWMSYGLIRVTAISYAGTDIGIAHAGSHKRIAAVLCSRLIERGRRAWTNSERTAVEGLCRKYAGRTSRSGIPLGYRRAFSLVVFEHKCPNTAPAILWAGGKTWKPLFKARPQLGFPSWPQSIPPNERDKRVLTSLGQTRLADVELTRFTGLQGRLKLLLLAAIAKKKRRPNILCQLLEISPAMCEELLHNCATNGWATNDGFITQNGLSELANARANGTLFETPLSVYKELYIPMTYRAARGSSSAGRQGS